MRILHIDTGREMRGGQYQVLLLHDALARADCEQELVAARRSGPGADSAGHRRAAFEQLRTDPT